MRHFLLLLCAFIFACVAQAPDESIGSAEAELGGPIHGFLLFNFETFDGNGRTCEDCHTSNGHFALSVAQVEEAFADDPGGPLFRSLDSDDGAGDDYTLLRTHASFRIPIKLAANVTIDERDENVFEDENGQLTNVVRRGVPTSENIFFEDHIMYDGREDAELARQSKDAVITHNEPGRLPTAIEQQAMANFQKTLYSRPSLAFFALGGPPPQLPQGTTAAEQRGREFFLDQPRGLCAMCHSGPLLNKVNAFNPIEFAGSRFATNFSSELNANAAPVYTIHFANAGLFGETLTMVSPDPGRALVTGQPCADDPAVCFLNPGSAASVFKIPTLWGVSKTAPYFHDSSAKTLEQMMQHYQVFFAITAQGLGDPSFFIQDNEAADIIAFLKLL